MWHKTGPGLPEWLNELTPAPAHITQVTEAQFASSILIGYHQRSRGLESTTWANNNEEGLMGKRRTEWIGHILGFIEIPDETG